jgi:hypothetical protein
MQTLPPPPVPQKLRELLKDYPEHLQEIQKTLDGVIEKPSKVTPPFEMAVWMLEDTLGDFMIKAGAELKAAEASGDPVSIVKAKEKRSVMGRAVANKGPMRDLWDYFQVHKQAFE